MFVERVHELLRVQRHLSLCRLRFLGLLPSVRPGVLQASHVAEMIELQRVA